MINNSFSFYSSPTFINFRALSKNQIKNIICFWLILFSFLFSIKVLKYNNIFNIINNDAPLPWQIGFQDTVSPGFTGIIELHNDISYFLTIILLSVFWILGSIYYLFNSNKAFLVYKYWTHGTLIELIWTITPAIILLFIAQPSFSLLYILDEVIAPTMTIKSVGHQWYWSYEYTDYENAAGDPIEFDSYMMPEADLESGQLRLLEVDNKVNVPVDTHIRLVVQSTDVIHSYAVPSLGIKLDAVPGRLNQTSIIAEREGNFYGQCSEICGVYHGFMPISLSSLPLFDYLSWLNSAFLLPLGFKNFLNIIRDICSKIIDKLLLYKKQLSIFSLFLTIVAISFKLFNLYNDIYFFEFIILIFINLNDFFLSLCYKFWNFHVFSLIKEYFKNICKVFSISAYKNKFYLNNLDDSYKIKEFQIKDKGIIKDTSFSSSAAQNSSSASSSKASSSAASSSTASSSTASSSNASSSNASSSNASSSYASSSYGTSAYGSLSPDASPYETSFHASTSSLASTSTITPKKNALSTWIDVSLFNKEELALLRGWKTRLLKTKPSIISKVYAEYLHDVRHKFTEDHKKCLLNHAFLLKLSSLKQHNISRDILEFRADILNDPNSKARSH